MLDRERGVLPAVHLQDLRQGLLRDEHVGKTSLFFLPDDGEIDQGQAVTVGCDELVLLPFLLKRAPIS